jgi:hypothetical protein
VSQRVFLDTFNVSVEQMANAIQASVSGINLRAKKHDLPGKQMKNL